MICPINLNDHVIDSTEVLRQTLCERVTLSTSLARRLGSIQVDAQELQAALIEIATRAHDAMPQGDRFVIETRNVAVYDHHSDIRLAGYVQLSLAHSGAATTPADLSTSYVFVGSRNSMGRLSSGWAHS